MGKKIVADLSGQQWDSDSKEPWLVQFEKEAVNDEQWSCLVTAAIQAEAQDEEYIQIYNQCAATGLRKAIKTITMTDVIKFLKEKNIKSQSKKEEGKKLKKSQREKVQNLDDKKYDQVLSSIGSQITELAMIYATFNDNECKLPPNLMAIILKYLILILKQKNSLLKRTEAAKKRKARRNLIRESFVRDMKPYESKEVGLKSEEVQRSQNLLGVLEPIDDEPYGGPDLYIMLSDFYDPLCFPELQRVNVPFVALLKITRSRDIAKWSYISMKPEGVNKKAPLISDFWQKLKENCVTYEKTQMFKNIAMMQYQAPLFKNLDTKQHNHGIIFDELSWMQYSAYRIYKQHQLYLQEIFVQRIILSLEPLDLSRCGVYNKLCDALVTGEPNTPCVVLYAMIEQVVAGVPHTESVPLEYESKCHDFFSDVNVKAESMDDTQYFSVKNFETKGYSLVTPCVQCIGKYSSTENVCKREWEKKLDEELLSGKDEWSVGNQEKMTAIDNYQTSETSKTLSFLSQTKNTEKTIVNENPISESLISRVLIGNKTDKDLRHLKKFVSPMICFYGDSVTFQTYHCDPRLLNSSTIVNRFLQSADLPRLWSKYPKLGPEDRAFYNYHFFSLWKISKENKESLKLKIFFALSMKLIGITKSYLYRGEEENISEMFAGTAREKKLSKVRFDQNIFATPNRGDGNNFSNYFFKTFIANTYFGTPRKTVIKMDTIDRGSARGSLIKTDSHILRKVTSQFNMYLVTHRSSGTCFPYCFRHLESNPNTSSQVSFTQTDKEFGTLSSLLDCFEISSINEPQTTINDKDDYLSLIQDFNFYEKLEPNCMIQRLLEAQEFYNTTQCSYFPPTDTLILIMYNDFDYRGIFYTYGLGALSTPVALRDFYNYVYPELSDWLMEKEADYEKFTAELQEKAKEEEEMKDRQYLEKLKKQFCSLNKKEREKFTFLPEHETDIIQFDIENLPKKPKLNYSNKVSFVTTNFADIRVESQRNVHEYHSKDGTEVNVFIDSWLYEPVRILTLGIKQSKMRLTYHQWLGVDNTKTSFFLKTNSDIIFSFYKNKLTMESQAETEFNFHLKISWPTGLIIEGIPQKESNVYIKQSYLRSYQNNSTIKNEKSRCYMKNGQVLIFKENGTVDILCASGEKHSLFEIKKSEMFGKSNQNPSSLWISNYESTTTSGEVWEKSNVGRCKSKKKLINNLKIYMGVDNKTQEIFYKREDGVTCLLRPCGKLVTMYPDGTKITSTPDFDGELVNEWSHEEYLRYMELESKQKVKSRTNFRKPDFESSLHDNKNLLDGFVLITCSYLMEHPKYSSVYFISKAPFVIIKMVEDLEIKIYPEGNYEVRQDGIMLKVYDNIVEFSRKCCVCGDQNIATVYLESNEILCKFVDFFRKTFLVNTNGETTLQDGLKDEDGNLDECKEFGKICSQLNKCENHVKKVADNQRCFAFERDLSGIEFLHADSLANHCYSLPSDTHFELDTKSTDNVINHIFSSPFYKVGYENWVMEYEDTYDFLPTNLKKIHLKELGARDNSRKLFKYPFPQYHEFTETKNQNDSSTLERKVILTPKVIMTRIVKCFPQQPKNVINDLQKYISVYQKKAHDICKNYKNHKTVDDRSQDSRYVKMRLKKIALTLNQSLKMYPHLCRQSPSTEKDIHYFGHFINSMDYLRSHIQDDDSNYLPECKQIPKSLPRSSGLECINEENELHTLT